MRQLNPTTGKRYAISDAGRSNLPDNDQYQLVQSENYCFSSIFVATTD